MKKYIVVTGGSGFIGSNLIRLLLIKTKLRIISIDDYSSGSKKNHVVNTRVKYYKSHTKNISEVLKKKEKKIQSVFHFGEYSRIYQSFLEMNKCIQSNTIGTNAVIDFCFRNKIRLIYSATSASLGNNGNDKNLSPYAFTKSKNLEFLNNLKKWFNFRYEVIFFYNVYGALQIREGKMATVIGIFENCYLKKKPIPLVKPGSQSRRFTHIDDTIEVCYEAWKKNKCRHYSIINKKSHRILDVAKMFGTKIKFLPPRKGERYASAVTLSVLSNKIYKRVGKIQLQDYIKEFKKNVKI